MLYSLSSEFACLIAFTPIETPAETATLPATNAAGVARRADAAKPAPATTVPATPVKMQVVFLLEAMIFNCSSCSSY